MKYVTHNSQGQLFVQVQVTIDAIRPGSVYVDTTVLLPHARIPAFYAAVKQQTSTRNLNTPTIPKVGIKDAVNVASFDPCADDCPGFTYNGDLVCGKCCDCKGLQCAAFYEGYNG